MYLDPSVSINCKYKLNNIRLDHLTKLCVNTPMFATRTCTRTTSFYAMVARPGYLTKILNTYTAEEEQNIVKMLNQIENQNKQVVPVTTTNTTCNFEQSKTINVSNISNVNAHPQMPTMYFPHSTVTIK